MSSLMSKCCFFFRFQSSLNVVHFLSGLLLVISVAPESFVIKEIVQTKDSKVSSMPRSKILLNWIARYSDLQFQLNQTVFLSKWDLSHSTKPDQNTADTHGL